MQLSGLMQAFKEAKEACKWGWSQILAVKAAGRSGRGFHHKMKGPRRGESVHVLVRVDAGVIVCSPTQLVIGCGSMAQSRTMRETLLEACEIRSACRIFWGRFAHGLVCFKFFGGIAGGTANVHVRILKLQAVDASQRAAYPHVRHSLNLIELCCYQPQTCFPWCNLSRNIQDVREHRDSESTLLSTYRPGELPKLGTFVLKLRTKKPFYNHHLLGSILHPEVHHPLITVL